MIGGSTAPTCNRDCDGAPITTDSRTIKPQNIGVKQYVAAFANANCLDARHYLSANQ